MSRFEFIILSVFIFLIAVGSTNAQSGMRFKEFAKKLEVYYEQDMIKDLEKKLPQGSDYQIWGWDVGDFSGDSLNDVAFAVKILGNKQKEVQVYLFSDIDGFLTLVGKYNYNYFELPLEVGIVIKQNACYVMKKHKMFEWSVFGYRFLNGNIVQLDEFKTSRIDNYTRDSYHNYQNLMNTEKFALTSNNDTKFKAKYLILPSYSRGKRIYNGFSEEATASDIEFVGKGAWYWKGPEDASFQIKSAYDEKNIYLTINVHDDIFVPIRCEKCYGDYLQLWFDISQFGRNTDKFVKINNDKVTFRDKEDEGIYSITIHPGDFLENKASIKEISSTDDLENYQKQEINNIKAVASLRDSGYTIKCKIPLAFLGYEGPPCSSGKIYEIGFTAVLHDIDNEFRPEEESEIASSSFNSSYPSSYGSLLFIPGDQWYGSSDNIYTQDIVRYLLELGF